MGQCCEPQVQDEPMPTHRDVTSLVDEMQRYKQENKKDLKTIERYNTTKGKIEAYKEKMKRGHTRSLTPATHSVAGAQDDSDANHTVFGHESFHTSASERFQKFKKDTGSEMKRRSRQPGFKDEVQEEAEDAPKKGKKVKKGRRGKKEEEEEPVPESTSSPKDKKKKKKKKSTN